MFFLLTIWAYTRFVRSRVESPQPKMGHSPEGEAFGPGRNFSRFTFHAPHFYILALVFYAAALMSKPTAVTLPFVLLLLDYWPLERFQPAANSSTAQTTGPVEGARSRASMLWHLFVEKLPFFGLAAAVSLITFGVQQQAGAVRTLGSFSLSVRLENALLAYCRYLAKLVWPTKLAAFYPHPGAWAAQAVLMAAALLVSVTVFVLALRRPYPYLLVGWLWYLGALVPVIGLIQVGAQSIADRYTYVPLIGILICLVWGAHGLTRHHPRARLVLVAGAVPILIGSAALTDWQIRFWRNSETLFRRSLAVTADNALARLNLGLALGEKNDPEAVTQLQAALSLASSNPDLQRTIANALIVIGHPQEAIALLQAILEHEPGREDAHLWLGRALASTSQLDEAVAQYQEAIRLNPKDADAHLYLGFALSRGRRFADAATQFEEVLKLRPRSAEAYDWLGLALGEAGRFDEAVRQFEQALKLQPDFAEAHNHWGIVLRRQRRFNEAISQFHQALSLNPNYTDAHVNLGVALYNKGSTDQAIREFQEALKIQPNHALARINLDMLLAQRPGNVPPPAGPGTN
jgi:tetratricopeptide (TPR) repeat protein